MAAERSRPTHTSRPPRAPRWAAGARRFSVVDSHTEGMPTRVVTDGFGVIPGATMAARRRHFVEHLDHLRRLLMNEPHGHPAMSGAILQPPTRPDADWGVVYIEVSGCLPMCGHGTIGVATVLVETGLVTVTEPVTTVSLDTPAGLVRAEVAVRDGRAEHVTIHNVASYAHELDATVEVPALERDLGLDTAEIRYDMAYGGNFYAITPLAALGIPFTTARKDDILAAGLAVMDAINKHNRPVHPTDPTISGCRHVQFTAPGTPGPGGSDARNAMAIHPGWFDRSPCGTGTSARMAQLHARGELPLHQDFVNESFIGTRFTGRLVGTDRVGDRPAVTPTVTGRAWITGMGDHYLDPTDPFPEGFVL
ncbi:proline racemase family protein [Streptomyces sp. MST-110588]|uniref:proline racemase family protein n=1 Tax=Streptomyces sp. MST-110588 TaxID=2833628 RepID=UPI0020509CE8|nr:proline racemase family protein [Streptomyces sp. MST-110588]UNO41648.1 proline racemase family protein [Streptomyces sp. MST-110588]